MRRWWSGLSQQTVNLSAYAFAGSNPARRTLYKNQLNFLSWAIFVACAGSKQTALLASGFEKRSDVVRRASWGREHLVDLES